MPQINNYKISPAEHWGPGVAKMKHLGELGLKAPFALPQVVNRAWTANFGYSTMSYLKDNIPTKTFDTEDEYEWMVVGNTWHNVPLIEARKADGTVVGPADTNVGQGGDVIYLVFPEAYFAYKEVIVGELNEYYQFRIIAEPVLEGSNAVYCVELMYGQETGVPGARLQAGERFSWEFAPVEKELSRKAGGIRRASFTKMRNEWTTIRKYNKYTGAANSQQKYVCSIPQTNMENGKQVTKMYNTQFDYDQYIFFKEWQEEKNRATLFSRSNRNSNGAYMNFGESGGAITAGDGLFAQLLYGHTQYYNDFNDDFRIDGLANSIYNLCETYNVPIDQRKFIVITGSRGMIQANKAINKLSNGFMGANTGYTLNADSLDIIKKVNSKVHDTALSFGSQFVEYRGANGLVLTFMLDPSLDNRERNKIPGPNGEGVLQSYAYYIFDMGTQMEPNMYFCKLNGKDETISYRLGIRNPFGIASNIASTDEDSAEIHSMWTGGICILDPSRCLSYLPAGLVA